MKWAIYHRQTGEIVETKSGNTDAPPKVSNPADYAVVALPAGVRQRGCCATKYVNPAQPDQVLERPHMQVQVQELDGDVEMGAQQMSVGGQRVSLDLRSPYDDMKPGG